MKEHPPLMSVIEETQKAFDRVHSSTKVQVVFTIDEEVVQELQSIAAVINISFNSLVVAILTDYINTEEKK